MCVCFFFCRVLGTNFDDRALLGLAIRLAMVQSLKLAFHCWVEQGFSGFRPEQRPGSRTLL